MKRKRQKQSKKERAQISKAPEIAPSQKFRQELHGEATEESAHHTVKDTVHFVATKDHVVKRFKVVMPSSMSL